MFRTRVADECYCKCWVRFLFENCPYRAVLRIIQRSLGAMFQWRNTVLGKTKHAWKPCGVDLSSRCKSGSQEDLGSYHLPQLWYEWGKLQILLDCVKDLGCSKVLCYHFFFRMGRILVPQSKWAWLLLLPILCKIFSSLNYPLIYYKHGK